MRELKFRVYDGELKYMLDNPLVTFQGGRGFTVDGYPPEARGFNIMQYTGRKDMNNSEIYDGDIIQPSVMGDSNIDHWTMSDGVARPMPMVVKWGSYDGWVLPSELNLWEVIGNIHENPELIKKETQ